MIETSAVKYNGRRPASWRAAIIIDALSEALRHSAPSCHSCVWISSANFHLQVYALVSAECVQVD